MVKDNDSDRDNGNSREIFNRRQGEIFDKVAQSFDRLKPPDVEEKLEDIVKSAQIKAGDAILDVGSGTGALLAPILKAMPCFYRRPTVAWLSQLEIPMLSII